MKLRLCVFVFLLLAVLPVSAEPVVSNVRAAQRSGTNVVDIYYDLASAGESGAVISVEVSENGGGSYGVTPGALSGDRGSGVINGRNRHIVWDAGVDKPDFMSTAMRCRVRAELVPVAVPTGFALIPAGSFSMGDSFSEGGSYERPVHTVSVSAFYMGTTEVTYGQWQAVQGWASTHGYTDLPAGSGKGTDHPVHSVSWYDVVKWCNAKSEQEGRTPVYRTDTGEVYRTGSIAPVIAYGNNGYRLPTEAEWEKAARGGVSGQRFPWGDTITHAQANYYSSSFYSYDVSTTQGFHPDYDTGITPYTSPVGSFAVNGYGLYDTAGNVWEWCNDWYSYYTSTPSADPVGPSWGEARVNRGGGWSHAAGPWRLATRGGGFSSNRSEFLGFRLALRSVP
jgi:formylglycine-generating enzyme required for sulfatase activity